MAPKNSLHLDQYLNNEEAVKLTMISTSFLTSFSIASLATAILFKTWCVVPKTGSEVLTRYTCANPPKKSISVIIYWELPSQHYLGWGSVRPGHYICWQKSFGQAWVFLWPVGHKQPGKPWPWLSSVKLDERGCTAVASQHLASLYGRYANTCYSTYSTHSYTYMYVHNKPA